MSDITDFHNSRISNNDYTILVLGNKSELERLRLLPIISDPNILAKSQNLLIMPYF